MRIKNKWYKELWFWLQEKFRHNIYDISPCTPEAKRHMKKVHKEKGRIGGVK